MNTLGIVIAIIAGLWSVLLLAMTIADNMIDRRYAQQLQVRDWEETVAAMRRMADQEGDA